MLWGRGNVPATPAQLRALFDDPLCKRLIYQLWTAQALAKLGGDPEVSALTDRQFDMIEEAAEAIDRENESMSHGVNELVPMRQHQQRSPGTVTNNEMASVDERVIVNDEEQAAAAEQAAADEGTPNQEAVQQRRAAEERRHRLVIELRLRLDAEQRGTAICLQQARTRTACGMNDNGGAPAPSPSVLALLPLELLGQLLVFLPAVQDLAADPDPSPGPSPSPSPNQVCRDRRGGPRCKGEEVWL